MTHPQRLFLFLLAVFLLPILAVSAQDESTSLFVPVSDEPAIPHSEGFKYTDPGAVVYHDGLFHMLRNEFPDWPRASDADYWTSEDGFAWEKVSDGYVFETDAIPYVRTASLASSLVQADDGSWAMYFYNWNGSPGSANAATIGRASAPSLEGPWTHDPDPILEPGEREEWDGSQLTAPHVIRTEDGYRMYYSANDARRRMAIGMATSADGITWEKYDDPDTTEAPFANSDPVLMFEGDWEGTIINQPRVMQIDDQWVMFYRGEAGGGTRMGLGMATSDDGITWEKFDGNPVFVSEDVEGGENFWFTNVVYHDGTVYLFVEIGPNNSVTETNIYVATMDWEMFLGG